mgnify:CR=1 FL=1
MSELRFSNLRSVDNTNLSFEIEKAEKLVNVRRGG